MKSIFLFSDDLLLIGRWSKLINETTLMIDNLKDLNRVSDSIIIINTSIIKSLSEDKFQNIIENRNDIMVLDNTPNLLSAKKFLNKGVKAYGNTLMTSSYINSCVEALQNNYIWLLPDISTKLMSEMINSQKTNDSEKTKSLFDILTTKETQIAVLLKEGYTNNKISQELNISINTVKTHIKHIYEKLDVKDRLSFASLFTN